MSEELKNEQGEINADNAELSREEQEKKYFAMLAEQKKTDPLIGVSKGSEDIFKSLMMITRDDKGVVNIHDVTLYAAGLAGYACQAVCVETNLIRDKKQFNELFHLIVTPKGEKFSYDVKKLKATPVIEQQDNSNSEYRGKAFIELNKKSGNYAYIKDNNLVVVANGVEKQLTTDGDSINIIYGQSVHRNEFGIEKGLFFAEDGMHLAYYRMDQSMVGDYPLVNTQEREAKLVNIKYPMAGMKSHEVLVYVYNFATQKTVMLKTRKDNSVEEKEMYLTNIAFSPDGKVVYIQKLNRLQNHMWMEAYNADNGEKIKVLFEETSNKYFEPEHPIVFLPNNPNQFLYFSERDGFDHLYLYDTDGNLIKQVTKGDWMVNEIAGFNKKATECYIYATKDSPLEKNFYSVNMKNGKITRITPNHGTHYVTFNEEGTYFVDSYTSTDVAYATVLLNNKGQIVKELDVCEDPFAKLDNAPTITIDTLHAQDGTVLYTRMIKPKDFNPSKQFKLSVKTSVIKLKLKFFE